MKTALTNAIPMAQVLEIKERAKTIYDKIKREISLQKAKGAHKEMVALSLHMQGNARKVMIRANILLADEYDTAKEKGEVAVPGDIKSQNLSAIAQPTLSQKETVNQLPIQKELGIDHRVMSDFRKLKEFDKKNPGVIETKIDELVEAGQEPTQAAINRMIDPPKLKTTFEWQDELIKKSEKMVSVHVLIEELLPLSERLLEQSKLHIAMLSRAEIAMVAGDIKRLIDKWASDDPTVRRVRGRVVPFKSGK